MLLTAWFGTYQINGIQFISESGRIQNMQHMSPWTKMILDDIAQLEKTDELATLPKRFMENFYVLYGDAAPDLKDALLVFDPTMMLNVGSYFQTLSMMSSQLVFQKASHRFIIKSMASMADSTIMEMHL